MKKLDVADPVMEDPTLYRTLRDVERSPDGSIPENYMLSIEDVNNILQQVRRHSS